MKTLQQVITDFSDATEHLSAMMVSKETWTDVLHYLKDVQDMLNNDPLTIEEIIALPEGTPLWIEGGTGQIPEWCLYKGRYMTLLEYVQGTQNDFAEVPCEHIEVMDANGGRYVLEKKEQGKMWNAYRRKRK